LSLFRLFSRSDDRRREKILRAPFPEAWEVILSPNVRHFHRLDENDRGRLRDAIRIIIAETSWEGCRGLEITDEIRVTIAAQAGILVLGIDDYFFDDVESIVIYPGAFLRLRGDVVADAVGEAVEGSVVVLSWEDAREGAELNAAEVSSEECNVVIHEFAHVLDLKSDACDGVPPLPDEARERWIEVIEAEFDRHVRDEAREEESILSYYGASSRDEFFAVSSEAFFQFPTVLRDERPELYELLASFYRQDPAERALPSERIDRRGSDPRASFEAEEIDEAAFRAEIERYDAILARSPKFLDGYLDRASLHLDLSDFESALHDYDAALRLDPDDIDALCDRAQIFAELGRYDEALGDCNRVLRLDESYAMGYVERASIHAECGDFETALSDLNEALRLDDSLEEAYELRAAVREELGDVYSARADRERAGLE